MSISSPLDTNGDQYLDPLELEAMFYGEVKNVYDEDHDQTEIREEMSRMREHVMKEVSGHSQQQMYLRVHTNMLCVFSLLCYVRMHPW